MNNKYEINHIVVPIDFSDTAYVAVDHAVDIAKRFDADMTLVHVLEKGAYSGIIAPSKASEYVETEKAQEKLQEDAHQLEKKTGLNIAQEIGSGLIYEEIIKVVQEQDADLVVMGTHGVSGWAEFFVGSNAFKVVTQSPCPVLTVQPLASIKTDCEHIILPIDSTRESRQKVKHAVAFAKIYGSTIHIASLLSEDSKEIRFEFGKRIKQVTDYLDKEEVEYTHNTLVGSNLATMTMNFAESKDGNLIVMMTEQESSFTGFLLGPFAQQIVNHSKIPVLSVPPADLTSGSDSFHALG